MKISFRPSRRFMRNLTPLLFAATYFAGSHILQTVPVDQLSMLSNSALTSIGRMRKPYGMGYWMFDCYIRACSKAKVNPNRVTQTIGFAKASAGFHAPDGVAREKGQRIAYTCALDISIRKLTRNQIYDLVAALHDAGFVCWYRTGPSWKGNNHIHAVFVGYPMKPQLRAQYRDAMVGKDGLKGHRKETFYTITAQQKRQLTALYNRCSLGRVAPKAVATEED